MYKMPREIEIVTPELLRRELTSRRFLDGLAEIISITQCNGAEARFDVQKQLFGNRPLYPDCIEVGTPKRVGVHKEAIVYAEELYQRATGKSIVDDEDEAFEEFCRNNRLVIANYPEVEPEFSHSRCPEEIRRGRLCYLFNVHTHPSEYVAASLKNNGGIFEGDVASSNNRRKTNEDLGIFPRTIEMIVGTGNLTDDYPILFFQEKTDIPISEEDFVKARNYIEAFVLSELPYDFSQYEGSPVDEQTREFAKKAVILFLEDQGKHLHNLAAATYSNGRIRFTAGGPDDLNKFAYRLTA